MGTNAKTQHEPHSAARLSLPSILAQIGLARFRSLRRTPHPLPLGAGGREWRVWAPATFLEDAR